MSLPLGHGGCQPSYFLCCDLVVQLWWSELACPPLTLFGSAALTFLRLKQMPKWSVLGTARAQYHLGQMFVFLNTAWVSVLCTSYAVFCVILARGLLA
jgi:hypothetical protein